MTGEVRVELFNGWTLVAPPGTSREAAEYAAERPYDDDYLPSPNGLAPAYRGTPLADPIADLKAAAEETP